ncbi:exportin-2 [Diabrotica virgifera virgifera]|uniref:Exportin-2 n=1 Tax=Diabrotica virgifera virgifera TaxID=50390 RepID=A0A6P7G321_DIAVI|nr:exportin-2 [Diabrotica virgifera virgifera]
MEMSDENIQVLSKYLQETLNPDPNVRRPAEKFLEGVEVNQNYPLLILNLVHKPEVDMTIRIAGAVAFKNYIKRNWFVEEDGVDRIHESDRAAIKNLIVTLMLSSPESIQKQLSDAISIIGKTDFPLKWPELISQMVEKFSTGDFNVINGVLRTGHSLFKKYRYEFKSQELWIEIKYVLEKLAQPLTDLFVATINLAQTHSNDVNALKVIYSSLVLICKVFYSLNFQDLPEFFEDNIQIWMSNFHTLLTADVKCLQNTDSEEAGIMEQLRSQVCDNIALYAQKYDEEFQQFLPQFVTDVWSLLVSTGLEPKYDLLVSNALQFLSSVAERVQYRHLFEDNNVLSSICEKVIIPNMEFRVSDEELFEDNPEEYTRRDIEGSDIDTRRRAACDLVNTLSQNFEQRIIDIFGQYLQVMLGKYVENAKQYWRSKDAALYLVTSLVSRGATQRHGVTQTSQLVDINQFCQQHILSELERPDVNDLPVLKADAIKYIMTFRSVLPSAIVISTIPQLIRHMTSESAVVHTYAACTLEKILIIKANNQPIVTGAHLEPFTTTLLTNLFGILEKPVSEENEYVMKALMRTFSTLQERVLPFLNVALPKLTEKLQMVAKNPSKPHFNHYLFETFSLAIRIVCKANPTAVTAFEDILFPIFQGILQQDIQEFIPYVFQILSLLMESTPQGNNLEPYMQLLPFLLAPVLWDRPANISPLVRLLCAFALQAAPQIVAQDKVSGFLGVFQKLIASKTHDHEGFFLIQSMIQHLPMEALAPYHKRIFSLLFLRLSSSKTTKYVINLIVFFSLYVVKYSANELISTVDDIQAEMFGKVLEKLYIAEIQKVSVAVDRKIVACGVTKLLCESPEIFSGKYQNYWPQLLQALLKFFEMPVDSSMLPDDHFIEVDDTPTYQTTSAKLNFANTVKSDPLQAIAEPRQFLVQSLATLGNSQPGRLPVYISNMDVQVQTILNSYLSKFAVQLV